MIITPLIMPTINPSAVPSGIIRRLNSQNIKISSTTYVDEFKSFLYFAFLIEGVRTFTLADLFDCNLGGVVIVTTPPDLNDIILGGLLSEWAPYFIIRSGEAGEIFKEIEQIIMSTELRKFFQ